VNTGGPLFARISASPTTPTTSTSPQAFACFGRAGPWNGGHTTRELLLLSTHSRVRARARRACVGGVASFPTHKTDCAPATLCAFHARTHNAHSLRLPVPFHASARDTTQPAPQVRATRLAQRVCVAVVEHVEAAVQVDPDGAAPPLAVALQDACQVVGQRPGLIQPVAPGAVGQREGQASSKGACDGSAAQDDQQAVAVTTCRAAIQAAAPHGGSRAALARVLRDADGLSR
jgi:hypothetical protein